MIIMIMNKSLRKKTGYEAVTGFTIIEVTVVLLIIGIVFITASPLTGKALSNFNLQHTALKMAADIRELQQRALSESSSLYFIEFSSDRYAMKKSAHPQPIKIATVRFPAKIKVEHTNFPQDLIRFSTKGTPSQTGGTVTIRDQSSGKCMFVIIASVTGRVRVSDDPPDKSKLF